MNHYHTWCNLKNTQKDMEFVQAIHGYLGLLKRDGFLADFQLTRRKLGFGLPGMGEFHITMFTENLAKLEEAFDKVAARSGDLEKAHARVYSMVTDVTVALYRDFPDPQRK